MLIGHDRQREMFLTALEGGRMHHAWLLTGPRGIGKRCFANWAALRLLAASGAGSGGAFGAASSDTPDIAADHPAARLMAAHAHPDLRVLQPPVEGKGSASGTIVVDQVRDSGDFLRSYPSLAKWRVMIVDTIDDMNIFTANAFLKLLEEPRPDTLFLLISHAPGSLLPTIRSRCQRLNFERLPAEASLQVLSELLPELGPAELKSLATLADGAPGTVLELGGADIQTLESQIAQLMQGDRVQGIGAIAFARGFADKAALPRLKALLTLAGRQMARVARKHPTPEAFALYDAAELLMRDAVRLAYDRVQVAMAVADLLARAGRIEHGNP